MVSGMVSRRGLSRFLGPFWRLGRWPVLLFALPLIVPVLLLIGLGFFWLVRFMGQMALAYMLGTLR